MFSRYHARAAGVLVAACGVSTAVVAIYWHTPFIIPKIPYSGETTDETQEKASPIRSQILTTSAVRLTISYCVLHVDGVLELKPTAFLEHSALVTEYLDGRFSFNIPRTPYHPFTIVPVDYRPC